MFVLIAGLVTALATTSAAVFMWKEWKMKTTPYITSCATDMGEGVQRIDLAIYPAMAAVSFIAVDVPGAQVALSRSINPDPETGAYDFVPAHDPASGRLAFELSLPPSSVSKEPLPLSLWVKTRNSWASTSIALVTRHMFFEVRNKVTTQPKRTTP